MRLRVNRFENTFEFVNLIFEYKFNKQCCGVRKTTDF
jgi:hypothetical protein